MGLLDGAVVLVTGGAGFIGSHLVERSLQEGAKKVVVLDNFVAGKHANLRHILHDKRLEIVLGDVCDVETVAPLVEASNVVFHEAASKLVVSLKNPRIDLSTNVIGTFNILEAARDKDVRIIHASTGSVLGSSDRPMPEEYPPNPTTLYGISKLSAEKYCEFYAREFGVKVTVLRYFHVFGPRQDYHGEAGVINIFLSRILRGLPPIVFGSGDQIRCFTYVADDTDANFLLLRSSQSIGEVYNVASRTRISVKDLAKLLVRHYGRDGLTCEFGPPRPGENPRPIPDTGRIEALGWAARTSFEEGLDLTKRWIEEDMNQSPF